MAEQVTRKETIGLMGSVIETLNVLQVCEEKLEAGEEIPEELLKLDHSLSTFQQQIDKRIALIERVDFEVEALDKQIEFLQSKKKVLKEIKERVKEHTKLIVEQFPEVEFRGTTKKLTVQKNGGKQGIVWKLEFEKMPYVLNPSDVKYCPEAYVIEKTVQVLNVPVLEEDIRLGKIVTDIAELKEKGTHLRIK